MFLNVTSPYLNKCKLVLVKHPRFLVILSVQKRDTFVLFARSVPKCAARTYEHLHGKVRSGWSWRTEEECRAAIG